MRNPFRVLTHSRISTGITVLTLVHLALLLSNLPNARPFSAPAVFDFHDIAFDVASLLCVVHLGHSDVVFSILFILTNLSLPAKVLYGFIVEGIRSGSFDRSVLQMVLCSLESSLATCSWELVVSRICWSWKTGLLAVLVLNLWYYALFPQKTEKVRYDYSWNSKGQLIVVELPE